MPILIFYVTHPDEATAKRISNQLLEKRLIACANIFPISSIYFWKGELQNDSEWVSIIKTRPELADQIEQELPKLHPYEVPCLIHFELEANPAYENWVFGQTQTLPIL